MLARCDAGSNLSQPASMEPGDSNCHSVASEMWIRHFAPVATG